MLSSALWIDFSIGSFKEFQQALLNTFARNISGDRWVGTLPCNLVDFVEEDDAMLSGFRIHVCSLEETAHIAMILVGPDAEAAQLELDGHVLPALWPDEGNDIGSIDIAELQGQKDGHTDDSRKQDRNENHDEVGKKEALAQRPVPELHGPHLVSLNLLLVYTLRVPKNRTKSKFFGESFCPL